MSNGNNVQAHREGDVVSLSFTGRAGEYFRIWIVNVCLSVVTLGIYSAWAKVRRKKYFYGNTLLSGAGFEYLADPKAIFKGRIIVVGLFAIYQVLNHMAAGDRVARRVSIYDALVLLFLIAFMILLPWLVARALAFNARNTAYRNVRFRFAPRSMWSKRSRFPTLLFYTWPFTLGLLYPYYAYRKRVFILDNTAYGTTAFSFEAAPGEFYWVYSKVVLAFIGFLAGSVVTVGIGALPFYIVFASYRDAAVAKLSWRHTTLGKLRFACNWKTWELFKLHFVNSLGVIFTLGLLAPWAAIRAARYQLQGISLWPANELDSFAGAAAEQVAATGDEAVDLLGFDFGF